MSNSQLPGGHEQLNFEAVRAHFSRVGKLDGLKKGDWVYVEFFNAWREARLIRRAPGDIWIAQLRSPVQSVTKVTVSVGSFGGKVAE